MNCSHTAEIWHALNTLNNKSQQNLDFHPVEIWHVHVRNCLNALNAVAGCLYQQINYKQFNTTCH